MGNGRAGGAGWSVGGRKGGDEAGRVGRQVGWYELVAVNVYTAQEGVCNSRVKNTLQSG